MASVKNSGEGYFEFGSVLRVKTSPRLDSPIFYELFNNFTCTASTLERVGDADLAFRVGECEALPLDGYEFSVHVSRDGVCVVGADERGLLHGYYTLLEMIEPICLDEGAERLRIPSVELWEKPDLKYRMVHYCLFPENTLRDMEHFIRYVAFLKCSHVVLEFWGTLKFDSLPELGWRDAYSKDEVRAVLSVARELGVEIVPMFNHWGHASQSRGRYGKHTVLDQNPRLATMFNFTGWAWRIDDEKVRALHAAVRRELIELCGEGELFHIGCDEAIIPESHEPIYPVVEYLRYVNEDLKSLGRRTIMWGDMLLNKKHFPKELCYEANVTNDKIEEIMLDGVPRDVIIADWQYNVTEHPFKSSAHLQSHGFEVMPCPYDEGYVNGACAVRTAHELSLPGVIHTTWHTLYKGVRQMTLVLSRAWNKDFDWSDDAMMYVGALYGKVMLAVGDRELAGWSKSQVGPGL